MTLNHLSADDDDSSNNLDSSLSSVPITDHQKRKFDDFAPDYDDVDILEKMRKHEIEADHMASSATPLPCILSRSGENSNSNRSVSSSAECSYVCESSNRSESTRLQLFVRMMSGGKTIVIHADRNDTVENLHQRIEWKTKIPVIAQRVIYKGKQLQNEQSLSYYSIEQDASLQLVGRMQSTEHPLAWQTIDDIMYTVSRMYKSEEDLPSNINEKIDAFFRMIPGENEIHGDEVCAMVRHTPWRDYGTLFKTKEKDDSIAKYIKIFSSSSVPGALVMLYTSSKEMNKLCAKSSIKLFLNKCIGLPKNQQNYCLPIVLEFTRLLKRFCPDQKLYVTCRNTLASMLETFDNSRGFHGGVLTFGSEI